MSEKIAFASWDFISLLCAKHRKELELSTVGKTPFYCCSESNCETKIPTYAYEKIHNDILNKLNDDKIAIGQEWVIRSLGKTYSCKVVALASGKQTKISVKCL